MFNSLFFLLPYILIIYFSLGGEDTTGRKMAITGLISFMYLIFALKNPLDAPRNKNKLIKLIDHYIDHELVIKVMGPEVK